MVMTYTALWQTDRLTGLYADRGTDVAAICRFFSLTLTNSTILIAKSVM